MKAEYQVCPVCEGTGTRPFGFYADQYAAGTGVASGNTCGGPVTCRTCQGKGVIERPKEQTK